MKKQPLVILLSILILSFLSASISFGQSTDKLKGLKILYVGYSPERDLPQNSFRAAAGISDERFEADLHSRMGEFEALLQKYFGKVTTMDARDYKETMSAEYDVTVFDAVPTAVRPLLDE